MKNFNIKRMAALLILTQAVFFVSAAVTGYPDEIMTGMRVNRYLTESLRLQKLARQSFASGEYDQAVKYASDAAKAAAVSDVFVKQQLKIYIANNKISNALQQLAQADLSQAKNYFPAEFYDAKTYYNLGLIARDARKWDDAITNADKVIETLALARSRPKNPVPPATEMTVAAIVPEKAATAAAVENKAVADDKETPLPAQYTVRSWEEYGDCFWNIAGRSWVYGDPERWKILYQANKDKIPDPKNPDLIEPGMIMEIPSINGEKRLGIWDSEKKYPR
jgi:nucleoid-associated protein YgaU